MREREIEQRIKSKKWQRSSLFQTTSIERRSYPSPLLPEQIIKIFEKTNTKKIRDFLFLARILLLFILCLGILKLFLVPQRLSLFHTLALSHFKLHDKRQRYGRFGKNAK